MEKLVPIVQPSRWALQTVRGVLALERRAKIAWLKIMGRYPRGHGWNWTDGFFTPHNMGFVEEEKFQKAYEVAVDLAGHDYRIPWRVHQAIWCASVASRLDGAFVELGTGRGFVMAAVMDFLEQELSDKKVFLLDLFLKPSRSGAGMDRMASHYADSAEPVRSHFSRFANVVVIEGDVRETVTKLPGRLAFIHVDLNDPEVEVQSLQQLWPDLVSGGVILLDDYANRGLERSHAEMSSFFGGLEHHILTTPAGQGIVIKAGR